MHTAAGHRRATHTGAPGGSLRTEGFFESIKATTTRNRPFERLKGVKVDKPGRAGDGTGGENREEAHRRQHVQSSEALVLTNLRSVSWLESRSLFKNEFFELFLRQVIQFHVELEWRFGDGL